MLSANTDTCLRFVEFFLYDPSMLFRFNLQLRFLPQTDCNSNSGSYQNTNSYTNRGYLLPGISEM